jgi:tetratricopeptide (TPR) repeat protein
MSRPICALLLVLLPLSAPRVAQAQEAHLFQGLGPLHWAIPTRSKEAQAYFDQGLAFLYAFNHEEALRAFGEATRLDPECAMAWWGLSTAHGPHINRPGMDGERAKAGFEAAQRAAALHAPAGSKTEALVRAACARFSSADAERWPARDRAYADAMREAYKAFPKDPEVGALFAEALLNLHPWSLWEGRHPTTGTVEAIAVLRHVLQIAPDHPQALHLWIHLWEASPEPERAVSEADRLRHRMPGLGHLDHMPAHIDVLMGHWGQAMAANEAAIRADEAYLRVRHAPVGLQAGYMGHSRHTLGFAAMMAGSAGRAVPVMDGLAASIPSSYPASIAGRMDWYRTMPFEVRKRFGRWEELLALPEPAESFPVARAMRHADRGVAFSALGRVAEAKGEAQAFAEAVKAIPADLPIIRAKAVDVLAVAGALLEGEIALAEGRVDEALARLRAGVEKEDALSYHEPPTWLQPVRHALGATLLHAGRPDEALAVYEADLHRWPANIWSLRGRWQSLVALGRAKEAGVARAAFEKAATLSDLEVPTSCLCIPGP